MACTPPVCKCTLICISKQTATLTTYQSCRSRGIATDAQLNSSPRVDAPGSLIEGKPYKQVAGCCGSGMQHLSISMCVARSSSATPSSCSARHPLLCIIIAAPDRQRMTQVAVARVSAIQLQLCCPWYSSEVTEQVRQTARKLTCLPQVCSLFQDNYGYANLYTI